MSELQELLDLVRIDRGLQPRESAFGDRPEVIMNGWLPLNVVCADIGVCRQTLLRYIRYGLVDGKKFGARWYVQTASIRRPGRKIMQPK